MPIPVHGFSMAYSQASWESQKRPTMENSSVEEVGSVVLLRKSSRRGIKVSAMDMETTMNTAHVFLRSRNLDLKIRATKKTIKPSHAAREKVTASRKAPMPGKIQINGFVLFASRINRVT